MILVSGGNDIYREDDDKELYEAIMRAVDRVRMAEVSLLIVYGASAETWRYWGASATCMTLGCVASAAV